MEKISYLKNQNYWTQTIGPSLIYITLAMLKDQINQHSRTIFIFQQNENEQIFTISSQ